MKRKRSKEENFRQTGKKGTGRKEGRKRKRRKKRNSYCSWSKKLNEKKKKIVKPDMKIREIKNKKTK